MVCQVVETCTETKMEFARYMAIVEKAGRSKTLLEQWQDMNLEKQAREMERETTQKNKEKFEEKFSRAREKRKKKN